MRIRNHETKLKHTPQRSPFTLSTYLNVSSLPYSMTRGQHPTLINFTFKLNNNITIPQQYTHIYYITLADT